VKHVFLTKRRLLLRDTKNIRISLFYSKPLHDSNILTCNYKYLPSRGKMLETRALTTENESAVYYTFRKFLNYNSLKNELKLPKEIVQSGLYEINAEKFFFFSFSEDFPGKISKHWFKLEFHITNHFF
jgi:hypothetical protein